MSLPCSICTKSVLILFTSILLWGNKWNENDWFFSLNLNGCYDNIWTSIFVYDNRTLELPMIEQIHIVFHIVDTHHRVMDYGSEIEFYVVHDLKI